MVRFPLKCRYFPRITNIVYNNGHPLRIKPEINEAIKVQRLAISIHPSKTSQFSELKPFFVLKYQVSMKRMQLSQQQSNFRTTLIMIKDIDCFAHEAGEKRQPVLNINPIGFYSDVQTPTHCLCGEIPNYPSHQTGILLMFPKLFLIWHKNVNMRCPISIEFIPVIKVYITSFFTVTRRLFTKINFEWLKYEGLKYEALSEDQTH